MNNFKEGQKVVCVGEFSKDNFNTDPIIGEIYTIREIYLEGLRFVEIKNPQILCRHAEKILFAEAIYSPEKFRPLDHQFAEDVIKMICELPESVEV